MYGPLSHYYIIMMYCIDNVEYGLPLIDPFSKIPRLFFSFPLNSQCLTCKCRFYLGFQRSPRLTKIKKTTREELCCLGVMHLISVHTHELVSITRANEPLFKSNTRTC